MPARVPFSTSAPSSFPSPVAMSTSMVPRFPSLVSLGYCYSCSETMMREGKNSSCFSAAPATPPSRLLDAPCRGRHIEIFNLLESFLPSLDRAHILHVFSFCTPHPSCQIKSVQDIVRSRHLENMRYVQIVQTGAIFRGAAGGAVRDGLAALVQVSPINPLYCLLLNNAHS